MKKKFRVTADVDYVMGYLRHGFVYTEVEAESEEEAKRIALEYPDWSIEVTDYRVEDYGTVDEDSVEVSEV